MKFKCRIAALAVIVLAWVLPMTAHAHETPDLNRKGSITVNMAYGGKAVSGGSLSAYYVGEIQEDDGNYRFVKTPELAAFPGDYTDLDAPELAQDIAAFVKENKLPACAQEKNKAGKAFFSGLKPGLYLIVQTEPSKGFQPINPFLVSVPMNEDGHYVYDVTAEGKFQLYQKPKPTEPTQPTSPRLPQTGQLNWPVPALAVAGLLLFSAGWLLRMGSGKPDHEK